MEIYLNDLKNSLTNQDFNQINVVMGNEACDLDSAVSSVVYAYLLTKLHIAKGISQEKKLFVPILNVHRSMLSSRKDVSASFEKISIPTSLILCKNDINLKDLVTQGKLNVTLVDHNFLASQDQFLEGYVTEIIDHHKDERTKKLQNIEAKIEPVGSCATLIAEEFYQKAPEEMTNETANLLYDTILLDTVNLSPEAKKATPKDVQYVEKLEELLTADNRTERFLALQKAKFDPSGLSFAELLTRDLKVVTNDAISIAIPSVTISLKGIPHLNAVMNTFLSENKYDLAVVMGITYSDGAAHREIMIFSANPSPKTAKDLIATLLKADSPNLGLKQISSDVNSTKVHLFRQGNSEASRKIVLPIVREFIEKYKNSS